MDAMGPWMEKSLAAGTLISTGGLKPASEGKRAEGTWQASRDHRRAVCGSQGGRRRLCRAGGSRSRRCDGACGRVPADAHRQRVAGYRAGGAGDRGRGELLGAASPVAALEQHVRGLVELGAGGDRELQGIGVARDDGKERATAIASASAARDTPAAHARCAGGIDRVRRAGEDRETAASPSARGRGRR